MNFETTNALRDLDERTPRYLRGEVFAHGDLTTVIAAVEVLQTLDPEDKTASVLVNMMRLI